MSENWMLALQQQNQISKVIETNKLTQRYGLVLSEQDAKLILAERNKALKEQRRIEFGETIISKIIYMIENLCEIVLANMVVHIFIRKTISEMDFKEDEYEKMKHVLLQFDLETIKQMLQNEIGLFLKKFCDEPNALLAYLSSAMDDIAVRLRAVAEND